MVKKITQSDLFKGSLLHRRTIIEVNGEEKIRNEIAPYLTKRSKSRVEDSFLKSNFTKEDLFDDGWSFYKNTQSLNGRFGEKRKVVPISKIEFGLCWLEWVLMN